MLAVLLGATLLGAQEVPPVVYGGVGLAAVVGAAGLLITVGRFERRGLHAMIAAQAERIDTLEKAALARSRREARKDLRWNRLIRVCREAGVPLPDDLFFDPREEAAGE